MNDKVFVTRSLEGDTDAFGTLVKRHYSTVRGLAAGRNVSIRMRHLA